MRRGLMVGVVAVTLAACGGDDEPDVAVADPVVADDDGGDNGGDDDVGAEGGADDGADAAGGGDSGGPSLADSYAACDLITLDDLTSRGVAVVSGPTQSEGDFGWDECMFADESGPAVRVAVFPPTDAVGAIGDQEEIPGIGARTTYSPGARTIFIGLDDTSRIEITIPFFLLDDPRDVLIELAEIAVG